jgi:hypothetical protein
MTSVLSLVSPRTGAEKAVDAMAAKAAEAVSAKRMVFMSFSRAFNIREGVRHSALDPSSLKTPQGRRMDAGRKNNSQDASI